MREGKGRDRHLESRKCHRWSQKERAKTQPLWARKEKERRKVAWNGARDWRKMGRVWKERGGRRGWGAVGLLRSVDLCG